MAEPGHCWSDLLLCIISTLAQSRERFNPGRSTRDTHTVVRLCASFNVQYTKSWNLQEGEQTQHKLQEGIITFIFLHVSKNVHKCSAMTSFLLSSFPWDLKDIISIVLDQTERKFLKRWKWSWVKHWQRKASVSRKGKGTLPCSVITTTCCV